MTGNWYRRKLRYVKSAAVVVAVTFLFACFAAPAGAAQKEPAAQVRAAGNWYRQVIADLGPLDSSLVAGLQAAANWRQGTATAPQTAQGLAAVLPDLQRALDSLRGQKPLAGHASSLADYVAGINLYLQSFRLEDAATSLTAGPLVLQLQQSFERIRQLGDITYDEGTAQLASLLGTSLTGADVEASRSIPDWSSDHLAPGAPLETSWSGTTAHPSGTQSKSRWRAAVRSDGAPSGPTVRADVDSATISASQLSGLARTLQQSEVRLSTVPGPKGDREAAGVLCLGLLVDAEAALAAEAAELAGVPPDATLTHVASALASIGSGLRASAR
jgi:hypothetical protein